MKLSPKYLVALTGATILMGGTVASANGGGHGHDPVTICHKGQTIVVDDSSVLDAHIKHGDTIGACSPTTTTPTTEPETSVPETTEPTTEPETTVPTTPVTTEPATTEPETTVPETQPETTAPATTSPEPETTTTTEPRRSTVPADPYEPGRITGEVKCGNFRLLAFNPNDNERLVVKVFVSGETDSDESITLLPGERIAKDYPFSEDSGIYVVQVEADGAVHSWVVDSNCQPDFVAPVTDIGEPATPVVNVDPAPAIEPGALPETR